VTPAIDILRAIHDPNILGDDISPAQEAALRALYGLPMTADQLEIARRCAGQAWRPGTEYREAAFVCGRRSGKSDKLAANVAIYEAFFRDHRLSAGETGVVLLLAQNMRQAKVVKGYVEGKIERSPVLRGHVVASRAQELELDNRVTIAIHPSSFRAIRGLSVVACICDEVAYWWTEEGYSNPDVEVVRAVRPAMATFPNAKLLLVSSPYAMSGVLWEMWQARNEDPDALVWHAPTALMNPTVSQRFLQREQRRDPETYEREYEATFTEALSSFLPGDAIDECIVRGRTDVPPDNHRHVYVAAIDAAFKGDRFTFAIVHREWERNQTVVVDYLTGWQGSRRAPVQLREVLPHIKAKCKEYWICEVYGDQYGAAPIGEALWGYSLKLKEVPFTQTSKADIYGTLRTLVVNRRIELPDHADLIKELRALELELVPGGMTRIGHPSRAGAHDDYAAVVALAAMQAQAMRMCGVG
jgi:hypothetical protein